MVSRFCISGGKKKGGVSYFPTVHGSYSTKYIRKLAMHTCDDTEILFVANTRILLSNEQHAKKAV